MDDLKKLEPGARSDGNEPVQAALESIAISLKRIADKLDGDAISDLHGRLDSLAWDVGQTLGRAFEIGSRKSG